MFNKLIRNYLSPILSTAAVILSLSVNATTVEFQTSQGNIQVNLFDEDTPKTVENFLSYVADNTYTNNIIHRYIPGFIVQGGAYTIDATELSAVTTKTSVINEPVFSNVKGTIAMAKISNSPNSATSQWYFNLVDNSSSLDPQNGGFTVFGQIDNEDTTTVETIEKIQSISTCSRFGLANLPLTDYECLANEDPAEQNYIVVNQIIIVDPSSATASHLTPIKNTSLAKDNSSGGTAFWIVMILFSMVTFRFKSQRK